MRARTTTVSKAAIAASRRYPQHYVWYFRAGANECFIVGGNSGEAFEMSGIYPSMRGVERRMYLNGRKLG